jgi:rhodanese-related sulfurtransferase
MSAAKYYLRLMAKYWKPLLKWLLRITEMPKEITVDGLFDRINSNQSPLLIDVRTTPEFNGTYEGSRYGHIPNARSIPMLEFESKLEDLASFKEKEIVTMCPGGGMSLVAVEILTEAGFKDVKSLKGGTDLWYKKGYPTTTS